MTESTSGNGSVPAPGSVPSGAKKKVAIVEDDPQIVEMYKLKLEKEGYEVKTAADGNEGIQLIADYTPDVVMLDLMMPNKTGIEMLEELRGKPGGNDVKVMILTNVGDDATTSQVYRLAPMDYIVKSEMTPQQVFERVQDVLERDPKDPLGEHEVQSKINPGRDRIS